jgi:hypothetical protein
MIHVGNAGMIMGTIDELGLSIKSFKLLIISIMILIIADFMKYKGVKIRNIIVEQELWCRWICYIGIVWFIMVFGIWGGSYDAAGFIYFQF